MKRYKISLTNQCVEAMTRAFLNREEGWQDGEKRYNVLQTKNKKLGLTKDEYSEIKKIIADFNYRGWEYKLLNK